MNSWVVTHFIQNVVAMLNKFLISIPLAVFSGLISIYVMKKKNIISEYTFDNKRVNAIILFVVYVMLMLQMAILFRQWGSILEVDLMPFDRLGGFRYIVLYGIANAFVFIPAGILLPIIWKKMNSLKMILLAGFCGSLFIELLQLILQCGVCQTEDLIMNTVGAGIGYWIFRKYETKKKI